MISLPRKLLLMGSSAYSEEMPPKQFQEIIDEAVRRHDEIIVGEAHGASRAFQRYLNLKGVRNVTVGHAKTMRFNVGDWPTRKYGDTLESREKALIDDCDYALIIWVNHSSVIQNNLEYLKRRRKSTFVYESLSSGDQGRFYSLN